MSMIKNRVEKNLKKLKSFVHQQNIEAFRIYDRDIPEFPFIVDKYLDYYVVYDRSEKIDAEKNHLPELIQSLKDLFPGSVDKIVLKKRERQEGPSQYEKLSDKGQRFSVRETKLRFWVNLFDYLDTGLFLDHRPLRKKIFDIAAGKTFLNLFCYTGSFSAAAAKAGARVTSVDMSKTYLTWAADNFTLNDLNPDAHHFIQADALQYLAEVPKEEFQIIFLDPPTFSSSKRMDSTFEVERDQVFLLTSTMKRLSRDGVLFFSTNKRNFKLLPEILEKYQVRDITAASIPPDFHDKKIHQAYEIRHKEKL